MFQRKKEDLKLVTFFATIKVFNPEIANPTSERIFLFIIQIYLFIKCQSPSKNRQNSKRSVVFLIRKYVYSNFI